MRKVFGILLIIGLLAGCERETKPISYGAWEKLDIPTKIELNKVYFANENVGYVVGIPEIDTIFTYDSANFIMTEYPGWIQMPHIMTGKSKYHSSGVSRTVPEVLNPSIFKTLDGGITWNSIHTPFVPQILDIFFLDENNIFIVTKREGVFKSIDGGDNWSKILENVLYPGCENWQVQINPYTNVCFFNENDGIVFRTDGPKLMVQTSNGGGSWSFLSNGADPTISKYFADRMYNLKNSDVGYYYTLDGKIFKSIDKGNNWEMISSTGVIIKDICFVNENLGYFINGTQIYRTENGGMDWVLQGIKNYWEVLGQGDKIVAFETGEIVLSDWVTGQVLISQGGDSAKFSKTLNLGSYQLNDVFFLSPDIGFAAGKDGLLLKYQGSDLE
jgi:photosystem II stability/assembly factor-like uncharacterized protein